MKITQIVDKLNISLVSHQTNSSLQLIIIDQLFTRAIDILANLAIINNRQHDLLALLLSFNLVLILFRLEMACFHLWQLAIRVLVFNMGVKSSIRTICFTTMLRADELLSYLFVFAPVYFLHYSSIVTNILSNSNSFI